LQVVFRVIWLRREHKTDSPWAEVVQDPPIPRGQVKGASGVVKRQCLPFMAVIQVKVKLTVDSNEDLVKRLVGVFTPALPNWDIEEVVNTPDVKWDFLPHLRYGE
jgi:hypothetical protein